MKYEEELDFAKDLALQAGVIMRRYFRAEDIDTTWKEDNTPVTIADTTINKLVIDEIKRAFPTHSVIGEEESNDKGDNLVWIVDPVDGTSPFSLGIPISTFLLALVDRIDGQPVVAVIYDPYLEQMYTAVRGEGAYLNGKPIHTSDTQTFQNKYLSLYGPIVKTDTINYSPGRAMDALTKQGANIYKMSSGAYTGAKIASGEFDGFVMGNGKPWDSATIALLVREAGGIVTDLEGKPRRFDETGFGCVFVANESLLPILLEIIKGD